MIPFPPILPPPPLPPNATEKERRAHEKAMQEYRQICREQDEHMAWMAAVMLVLVGTMIAGAAALFAYQVGVRGSMIALSCIGLFWVAVVQVKRRIT